MNKKKIALPAIILGLGIAMPTASNTNLNFITAKKSITLDGKTYQTDYDTLSEATKAAEELSNEAAAEGTVLLKNKDNAMPLAGNEHITLFGGTSDYVDSFENTGFKVYSSTSSNVNGFSSNDEANFGAYNDVAVIFISSSSAGEGRGGGMVTDEVEDNKDIDDKAYGYGDDSGDTFTHKSLAKDADGKEYKHSKQIGDAYEKLIDYADQHFRKVVVMLTSSSSMEIGSTLKANDKVDAIFHVGSLGESGWQGTSYAGYEAAGKLLSGEVNPSGRTYDLWAWDFTASPTWANDGNSGNSFNSAADEEAYQYTGVSTTKAFRTSASGNPYKTRKQHTSSDNVSNYYVAEYEEDIYSGYRYYETAAAEAALNNYADFKYDHAVAYPFGYGLSYTSFKEEILSVDDTDWGKQQSAYTKDGKMTIKVKVTNTGNVAGKDVVEIYGHSPYYSGGVSKAETVLLGYEKTVVLKPGEFEIMTVEVKISDMASFDYLDKNNNGSATYELEKVAANDGNNHVLHDVSGHYELRLQKNSHDVVGTYKLDDLTETIILDKDQTTGKTITNVLSQDNIYNTLSYDPSTKKTLVEEGKMTILDRSNFAGTFPQIAVAADMVRSDEWYNLVEAFADYEADDWKTYYKLINPTGTATSEDEAEFAWSITAAKFNAAGGNEWKQGDTKGTIKFRDITGVDYNNTTVTYQNTDSSAAGYTTNSKLVGKTGRQCWNELLNQMTWDEMKNLVSQGAYQTLNVDSIEKPASRYMDSALVVDQELWSDAFNWGDCPHYAGTWNKELAYRRGIISGNIALLSEASSSMSAGKGLDGWYAPAIDLHRSPFGGRSSEYFSEDPILSGETAGNIVAGMANKGIICTIKHTALNECETQRINLQTYVSEQAARELYFKAYQIVLQDYHCGAIMTSYNCIGDVHSDANYAFMNDIIRGEWGFDGFATSDAVNPTSSFFTMDSYLRAGNNLLLSRGVSGDANEFCAVSGTYDATANVVKLTDGSTSYTQWYWVRMACYNIINTEANSAVASNGINPNKFVGSALASGEQGKSYSASVASSDFGSGATYKIVDGELPAGLSLNSNGTISGTPTVTGSYAFTVKASSSGYISKEAQFTLTIDSTFSIDTATNNLQVGKAFDGYVESTYFTTANFDSITYAVNDDSLPEGLTIDEATGKISGTPTKAGTYKANITVTGTKTQQGGGMGGPGFPGGMGQSTTSTIVVYEIEFVVAEDPNVKPEETTDEKIAAIEAEIAALEAKLNDSTKDDSSLDDIKAQIAKLEDELKTLKENQSSKTGGCGGSIVAATSSIGAIALLGAAMILKKKKAK